jgi:ribonuclease E
MLIDAAHPEEIRVAILNGNRLEEFDVETATKRQIKGNIYLARVTRVEPSLQAAFIEYGGNRHGFLAFNEIHPDYYRIPVSDRAAFKSVFEPRRHDEPAETEADAADGHDSGAHSDPHPGDDADYDESTPESDRGESEPLSGPAQAAQASDDVIYDSLRPDTAEREVADVSAPRLAEPEPMEPANDSASREAEAPNDEASDTAPAAPPTEGEAGSMPVLDIATTGDGGASADEVPHALEAMPPVQTLETVGGDETEESEEAEAPRPRFRSHRHYKIQEVIKRRQIMLVQVTKEERGNKGAAMTTYLSLAGRYCVLMPNTPRGGGVSRKITSMQDRRRLKDLMSDLSVPEGMGVIVRTAGSERSKPEIKRDFEYLQRLWDEIRDLTLKSTAPALVYEEGNLIKRSIRDLYSRDLEEVVVDGDDGYRAAKTMMKMLMPSHAKRVKPYRDPSVPLFHRYQAEGQIDAILSPVVQLRSGGYIVINPTEALVAIDVNSGRSTRERNIEETALRTNLEAAEEVARQLRLRDLAGLIVIDFIDMEEGRNVSQVERRVKDAMRHDRARIQLGRISPFGLMELSRQRLRPSVLEASTEPCPHCGGTGHIRSTESTALHILRAIEEEGMRRRSAEIGVAVPTSVALYLLNHKREALSQAERRYGFHISIGRDDTLMPPAFRLDRLRTLTPEEIAALPPPPAPLPFDEEEDDTVVDDEAEAEADAGERAAEPVAVAALPIFGPDEEEAEPDPSAPQPHDDERGGRRRHRRHRGEGRGRRDERNRDRSGEHGERHFAPRPPQEAAPAAAPTPAEFGETAAPAEGEAATLTPHPEGDGQSPGERKRRRRGRRGGRRRRREPGEAGAPETAQAAMPGEEMAVPPALEATDTETAEDRYAESEPDQDIDIAAELPAPAPEPPAAAVAPEPVPQPREAEPPPAPEPAAAPRRGWWRRL